MLFRSMKTKTKVKVKFRDTEFGLYKPSFTVPVAGSAERFRGVYLEFEADGVPYTQLVLEHSILRHKVLDETWDENPFFAAATDRVYLIIKRILNSYKPIGEEIEIEYEGEDMEEKTIEVPAGTDRVTLNIKREAGKPRMGCTLAEALAMTPSNRPVLVRVREPNGLRWDVNLGPVTIEGLQKGDDDKCRAGRINAFSACRTCDAQALLERLVRAVAFEPGVPVGVAIAYEVDADGV